MHELPQARKEAKGLKVVKTKAEDRKWMKVAAEEHGCMDPQRFCDSFDCTTVHRLISDVEDGTKLLGELNEAARLRSLLQATCESCGADGNIDHSPTCLRVATDIFLQEPNKGVDSDKK